MAESMIERVARVICAKDPNDYEWDWLTEGGKAHFLDAARAAIEAMKEPTVKMQQVVAAQWGRRTWEQYREVIDAALKEQP